MTAPTLATPAAPPNAVTMPVTRFSYAKMLRSGIAAVPDLRTAAAPNDAAAKVLRSAAREFGDAMTSIERQPDLTLRERRDAATKAKKELGDALTHAKGLARTARESAAKRLHAMQDRLDELVSRRLAGTLQQERWRRRADALGSLPADKFADAMKRAVESRDVGSLLAFAALPSGAGAERELLTIIDVDELRAATLAMGDADRIDLGVRGALHAATALERDPDVWSADRSAGPQELLQFGLAGTVADAHVLGPAAPLSLPEWAAE